MKNEKINYLFLGGYKMNYTLSKSRAKMLKIALSVWATILTILTLLMNIVFISKGGYFHSVLTWSYILSITTYVNVYRFYKMLYNNNQQISLLQLKIWSMFFARGIFVACLYLAFYVKNILGIIFFILAYLATFFCNRFLIKAQKSEK